MDPKKKVIRRLRKSNSFNLKNVQANREKGGVASRIQKFMKKFVPTSSDSSKFQYDIQTSRSGIQRIKPNQKIRTFSRENRKYLEKVLRDRADKARQLQKLVHANYEKFVLSSKEIENFLSEIIEVSHDLNQLKQNVSLLYKCVDKNVGDSVVDMLHSKKKSKVKKNSQKNKYDGIEEMIRNNEMTDILLDLEMTICENRFSDAMDVIAEIHKEHDDIIESEEFNSIFKGHKAVLKSKMTEKVYSPLCKKNEFSDCISFLRDLTSDVIARHIFLKCQEFLITKRINSVFLKGDLLSYIKTITTIKFDSIIQVKREFTKIFNKPSDISAFIQWNLNTLQDFTKMIKIQIYSSDSLSIISSCMKCLAVNFASLEAEGICIQFRLEESFQDDLVRVIQKFSNEWKKNLIFRSLKNDNYKSVQFTLEPMEIDSPIYESESARILEKGMRTCVSKSGKTFFNLLINFTLNVRKMGNKSLCSSYINVVEDLLNYFSAGVIKFVQNNHYLEDRQYLTILTTFTLIHSKMLCWIEDILSSHFNRRFPEIGGLIEKIRDDVHSVLYNTFIQTKANLLYKNLEISEDDYPKLKSASFDTMEISKGLIVLVQKFFPQFIKDTNSVKLRNRERRKLLFDLIKQLLNLLNESAMLQKVRKGENANFELNKIMLDFEFIKRICQEVNFEKEVIDFIDNELTKTLLEKNVDVIIQDPQWFLEVIDGGLKKKRVRKILKLLEEVIHVESEIEEETIGDKE